MSIGFVLLGLLFFVAVPQLIVSLLNNKREAVRKTIDEMNVKYGDGWERNLTEAEWQSMDPDMRRALEAHRKR